MFGGSAGPGKTSCLIALATQYVDVPTYRGIIFRRTFPQLSEIIDRTRQLYPVAYPGAEWREQKKTWFFPSGAQVRLGHIQHEGDKYDYQGHEYQFIAFDELTQFTETQYTYLFSRCRRTLDFPYDPIVRSTTNPGGIGHAWVKRRFRIGNVDPGTTIWDEFIDGEGQVRETSRVFISAHLEDNPSLNRAEYERTLQHLPEIERKRLLLGLWDAFEGQAFRELNYDLHSFEFDVPPDWQVFGSFDWGSAKPWSYGLWAVDYDGRLYRFAEAFGGKKVDDEWVDEGLRQTETQIAREILDLEEKHGVTPKYRVADPAIWSRRPRKEGPPGPSVEENMRQENIWFIRGDNDRISGRRQLHHRLALQEDEKPSVFIHRRCTAWWQFVPLLVEDPKNPEDILEKDQPDHPYDETRYALMSRPMRPHVTVETDAGSFQAERRKLILAKQNAARRGISVAAAYGRR